MNLPDINTIHLIDRMTQSKTCFALYRLPWTDEPILVLQGDTNTCTMNELNSLNGQKGFVMAPFVTSEKHPIVLIRPDWIGHQWHGIADVLQEFSQTFQEEKICRKENQPVQSIETSQLKQVYQQAFEEFIEPLHKRHFQKLVLSRSAQTDLPEGFSALETFVRACNSYPRMMISLCHTPVTGTWLGSTPEIILSGQQNEWHTVALAGTMTIQNEVIPTEWSHKNQEEQALVSNYIRNILKNFGCKVSENGPYTARAGHLVHLKTDFSFQFKTPELIGQLLTELHPTPAVCGLPKKDAYAFIPCHEGYDREYYSGIIGWLDPMNDTTLYVNLRCMHIQDTTATLYAGGGILPQSTPDTEWEETMFKMNTMQNIL